MTEPTVVLLVAHPRPNSFNHSLARRLRAALECEGARVHFHDLHAEGFDPLLAPQESYVVGHGLRLAAASSDPLLAQHRAQIAAADALVVVHPNWWGMPPAILTGWLDRVLVPGVAYTLSTAGGHPESLLRIRRLLVVNTTDTPAAREQEVFGDPLALIWERCVGSYLGSADVPTRVERHVLASANEVGAEQRRQWVRDVGDAGARLASDLRS
ncbi:NAD(P)H-dependent oxidoreductase [Cellulomonas sp. Leaf334]|uniref:NAD(P)H-dependent oxidoreductase n=1 Tax=Cellulomonas sp. Leaf334 TaxID=1736339 RepID=UPI0006F83729|nr:NAD(P)H-dependent oxidoreductase [Cellulomonas sp. Leaf334]KQR17240.1 NAD(P)H dehydrogenase [Cellulomonas sp. Leaf334]